MTETPDGGGVPGPVSPEVLEARIRGLQFALGELLENARRHTRGEHQRAVQLHRQMQAETVAARRESRGLVEAATAEALATAEPAARLAADRLAPGLASIPPNDARWRSRQLVGAGTPSYVRVGELETGTPVVAPLLRTNGWKVTADRHEAARRLLQSVALRLVASAEPFRLRIDAFDPRLTGMMGLLGHLTTKYPQLVPRATHTADQLHTVLSGLVDVSSMRASRQAQLGHKRFEDLVRESGRVTDPYRLIVLFDYPAGIDNLAQRDLVRLAATGADRGICFLVHHDPSSTSEHEVDARQLLTLLDPVAIINEKVELSQLPNVPAKLDPAFDANVAAGICDVIAELAEIAVLPTIDFNRTLPERHTWWQPVTDELNTVIGYDDRTPALVRLRSGNPALPHVLVGGAVGQGKSNLLLVLIHGLAARYTPADLEMYLLDFKHGVEFSSLGPANEREHWLPHVRVLGIHSDRAFGLAVLRHLSDELARRSEIFKSHGNVADIAELPVSEDRPPRILAVLDEFQVLLEDDDELADEAARLLERLVRLGRAYGVHVVLATQTIEGVKRLSTRRDSIFGQVPYRIALKTTPADSQAILRTGNTAAAELQFRGEAVLNANFGSPDDNQHVLVSFADKVVLDDLRRELWEKAGTTHPPRVFHLAEPARVTDTAAAVRPELGGPWTGLPIAVTEEPVAVEVRPEPGAGVLVLGDGPADALGVLTGLAVSAAAAAAVPPRFIFMDGTDSAPVVAEGKGALIQTLQQLGCEVETVDKHGDIVPRLFSLRDTVRDGHVGGATYLLGFGFHGVPKMQLHADGFFESPANALQDIVRGGPAQGLVTFGWWNRLHVCTEQLGFNRANVATHLFLRHPQDGVRAVAGSLIRWASEPHRALLWDGLHPEAQVVVPFAPLRFDEVDRLLELVRR
ncbi:FtsK/SpoIIIE domain-containing protein [Kribbella sp. VKM Ac-2568]|uniref:FtsK/SpoIIIE domain-containing protein n=1 Tax=Kribbella sp. VKM Ac-2568 TaxID=2512219 RepID=UPI0010EC6AE7|nr:FtsK/SpoIIIE domain-containing protein [Kribbella sp. VKM Ac-2568]TCM39587.1 FtsK/SpoIIIE family protein [Kribbella sp. VKM Ac-2568]